MNQPTDSLVQALSIELGGASESLDIASRAIQLMKAIELTRGTALLESKWQDRDIVRKITFSSGSGETNLANERLQVNAYKIPFNFKSVRVQKASGADVEVNMILGSNTDGKDAILLRQNDVINVDGLTPGWLYWEAQAGETMEIIFGIDIQFRQGSLISQSTGGVVVSEGTSISTGTVASVGTTAAVLCAASTSRVMTTIQNKTGQPIYLGGPLVTVASGFELAAGGVYELKNSDALYAIASTTTSADVRIMDFE